MMRAGSVKDRAEVLGDVDIVPALRAEGLSVSFNTPRGTLQAVSEVDLTLHHGRILALVGESGSGKSTVARSVLGLTPRTGGEVLYEGRPQNALRERRARSDRRQMQMVFQDPVASLNPRRRVRDIVAEPLIVSGVDRAARRVRAEELLAEVGLDPAVYGDRLPREISGGQAQRVAIARAIAAQPTVLVADEPVSGLDVSVQATVLNLLRDLTDRRGLSILFISHDLGVVRALCDDVAVLYLGRLCETGPTEEVLSEPAHPYTAALRAAVPEPGEKLGELGLSEAEPPSPLNPPSGCTFRTRCLLAHDRCAKEVPQLRMIAPGRQVACHSPLVGPELLAGAR